MTRTDLYPLSRLRERAGARGVLRRRFPPFAFGSFPHERIVERQRIEVALHPRALALGRLHRAVPARGEAETLQGLGVELQHDRLGRADERE